MPKVISGKGNFHFAMFCLYFSLKNSHQFIVQFSFKGGSNDSQLQTTLGKSVAVVLGVTPDVVLFDKMRSE